MRDDCGGHKAGLSHKVNKNLVEDGEHRKMAMVRTRSPIGSPRSDEARRWVK
jgi:hypothetical protein